MVHWAKGWVLADRAQSRAGGPASVLTLVCPHWEGCVAADRAGAA